MNRVTVLMSTYNGEKYICEQIDSILAQERIELRLLIRDDGSSDNTAQIIKTYHKNNNNIVFLQGNNIGVGNSFMALVKEAGMETDYYAFSDQDDIWLPEKMIRAIKAIECEKGPWCYCSNQTLVDAGGNLIEKRHNDPIDVSYMQILNNNQVTGCTMLWNRDLQKLLIKDNSIPSQELLVKRIHDVWVAMVAAVTGNIYYDSNSYILYRQHENNVVGVKKTNVIYEWKKKLSRPELRNGRSTLAYEVLVNYGDVIEDQTILRQIDQIANYRRHFASRLGLLKNDNMNYYSKESKLMYRLKVALGLL